MDRVSTMNLAIYSAAIQGILSNPKWKGTPDEAVSLAREILRATYNHNGKGEPVLA